MSVNDQLEKMVEAAIAIIMNEWGYSRDRAIEWLQTYEHEQEDDE